ncbi:unnamed protein product [Onchocerca flexuosa]|uniref:Fructose-bisphosphate aldolase n=1 Tax=Onchocerca flexuosa TaxID=387005 RepID=A0A183HQ88_9BILA|nr:unnamed protein product [Onchocerca flexuosa]
MEKENLFVNYVNEICQSNYEFKSIASAVSDVGIPQWVVDIRHGATHSHLPSLENLRQAAMYCRSWLWVSLCNICGHTRWF